MAAAAAEANFICICFDPFVVFHPPHTLGHDNLHNAQAAVAIAPASQPGKLAVCQAFLRCGRIGSKYGVTTARFDPSIEVPQIAGGW
jgi:hypothetical protein